MSRFVIPVVIVAAFLSASVAGAKEPPETQVCGRSVDPAAQRTCLTFDWGQTAWQLADTSESFSLRPRPRPAPFYVIKFRYRGNSRLNWSYLYVPSRRLIRVTTPVGISNPAKRYAFWRTAPTNVTAVFETLSKRARPFPAPRSWR